MNIIELLGLKTTLLAAEKTIVEVDVTDKLMQPFGIVHGGINALLAETAASLGANEANDDSQIPVGVDIQVAHLKAVSQGHLIATATPLSAGRTLQVWNVKIRESIKNELTSTATVTLINKSRPV
ncbi:PaaI family thioesterase [Leuconostoc falkenbergense]|uniref:PaaI family thioesterase n=1 Tax=Leuconostoc falkenbergense TaxID=2766470 RepID=UPI0021A9ECCD|nr:PaaI family thioesterase [Leuconostoc falkenbergense]MCT4404133.1 PaaI family thioesterase [Leuconostoc falkenbergense]